MKLDYNLGRLLGILLARGYTYSKSTSFAVFRPANPQESQLILDQLSRLGFQAYSPPSRPWNELWICSKRFNQLMLQLRSQIQANPGALPLEFRQGLLEQFRYKDYWVFSPSKYCILENLIKLMVNNPRISHRTGLILVSHG